MTMELLDPRSDEQEFTTDDEQDVPAWPPPPPARRPNRGRRLGASMLVVATLAGAASGYARAASLSSTSTGALSVRDIAAAVEPSVVIVTADVTVRQGPIVQQGTSAGTGIVLTSDGQILTNAHVVSGADTVKVTLNGETTARAATVIGVDDSADIALLQVEGVSGLTPATLGSSSALAVGDDVVAIGNALDLAGGVTVTRGIVSALDRTIDVENRTLKGLIQTDAAISSGNSGGPLVNSSGEVVGINSAGANSTGTTTVENIGFAIPIEQAMQIVGQLRSS
jgi:S1-C subfamily serine protease